MVVHFRQRNTAAYDKADLVLSVYTGHNMAARIARRK